MKVVLVGINSQYFHSNLAIRYLKSFTKDLDCEIVLKEFTINDRKENIVKELYKEKANIIGFSTYIWNVTLVKEISELLKIINEDVEIVYGGPEVSYDSCEILKKFSGDYIIEGEGEETFREFLIEKLKNNDNEKLLQIKGLYTKKGNEIIYGGKRPLMNMNNLVFPYEEDEDLKNKIAYFESSRGCSFMCSYCLSSTTHGVRFLDIDRVKKELKYFVDKGVSLVKFVDRTFNCNHKFAKEIWSYLIECGGDTTFHFEISADLLTKEEIEILSKAPKDKFQFEVGVQTTNNEVLRNINRFVNYENIKEKVDEVKKYKNIKQHLDLIAGLPGENLESFIKSFNDVYAIEPEEIQLGFLKLLKGSKMREDAEKWGMKASPYPPYEILYTKKISYKNILVLKKVEEMVDKYYNAGKFDISIKFLLKYFDTPFEFYKALSDFYEEQGYFKRNISNTDYYKVLLDFSLQIIKGENDIFLNLLKHEYLLYNKKKWIPDFLDRIYLDKKVEKNLRKNLSKQDHIEVYNYDVLKFIKEDIINKEKYVLTYYDNGNVESIPLINY
ncbi:B12-binding domain-containing radical SAM protein [Clostridium bornimense]|uniref:B12-binding domain-containing radical SAM protein n=1 Tax=Clostridium bornimense TaxID=1216932 RepID=UPI001C1192E0|nr:B12-binding domain-containing radical SAM protein [Clostridium bornimense]MBU5317498.1 B12-binding domain-containing radical SAM protein [Clostridium bornimense]